MTKLNREEILVSLLQTLVGGWGRTAVQSALDAIGGPGSGRPPRRGAGRSDPHRPRAVDMVAELGLEPDRAAPLTELAIRFDEGSAFPKISDIRSFLLSHQRDGGDLKGRTGAFRRMLPVLAEMSPKGLDKLLSRSHHSGPADLGAISDAIRGAGESLRGTVTQQDEPEPGAALDPASDRSAASGE